MKVRAAETRYIDVEVSPRDLYGAFLEHFCEQSFPDKKLRPLPLSSRDSIYISEKGYWEHWQDGHGSGYKQTFRQATDEEKSAMATYESLKALRNLF